MTASAKSAAKKSLPRIVGLVAILVLGGLVYTWSAGQVIHVGYQISSLQEDLGQANDLNRKLRLELASLRRPERIEALATGELGLVKPAPERVVVLK